jgi:hypothetical protein
VRSRFAKKPTRFSGQIQFAAAGVRSSGDVVAPIWHPNRFRAGLQANYCFFLILKKVDRIRAYNFFCLIESGSPLAQKNF